MPEPGGSEIPTGAPEMTPAPEPEKPTEPLVHGEMTGAQATILFGTNIPEKNTPKGDIRTAIESANPQRREKINNASHYERDAFWSRPEYEGKDQMTLWEKHMNGILDQYRNGTEDEKKFLKSIGIEDTTNAAQLYEVFMRQEDGDVEAFAQKIVDNNNEEEVEKNSAIIKKLGANLYGDNSAKVAELLASGLKNTETEKKAQAFVASAHTNIEKGDTMPGRDIITTLNEHHTKWEEQQRTAEAARPATEASDETETSDEPNEVQKSEQELRNEIDEAIAKFPSDDQIRTYQELAEKIQAGQQKPEELTDDQMQLIKDVQRGFENAKVEFGKNAEAFKQTLRILEKDGREIYSQGTLIESTNDYIQQLEASIKQSGLKDDEHIIYEIIIRKNESGDIVTLINLGVEKPDNADTAAETEESQTADQADSTTPTEDGQTDAEQITTPSAQPEDETTGGETDPEPTAAVPTPTHTERTDIDATLSDKARQEYAHIPFRDPNKADETTDPQIGNPDRVATDEDDPESSATAPAPTDTEHVGQLSVESGQQIQHGNEVYTVIKNENGQITLQGKDNVTGSTTMTFVDERALTPDSYTLIPESTKDSTQTTAPAPAETQEKESRMTSAEDEIREAERRLGEELSDFDKKIIRNGASGKDFAKARSQYLNLTIVEADRFDKIDRRIKEIKAEKGEEAITDEEYNKLQTERFASTFKTDNLDRIRILYQILYETSDPNDDRIKSKIEDLVTKTKQKKPEGKPIYKVRIYYNSDGDPVDKPLYR